ncbi:MAG: alpha/beta hydrolase [Clostridia bacterium]|nr:alpha/beta hydrolase [Clostridia bacterium]
MPHEEFIREIEKSDTAVVFIHGIMGSPDHFLRFIPRTPDSYSIYNLLLGGHGGSVADFCRSSMKQWKAQVSELIASLCQRYPNIIIVGHSMGTLFAIEEAVKRPDRVKKLFLLAVPLKIRCNPSTIFKGLKLFMGKMSPDNPAPANASYSLAPEKNKWKLIGFIPRYMELFFQISRTRKLLKKAAVPALAFQSALDELVAPEAADIVRSNPHFDCRILEKSHHSYYERGDEIVLCDAYSSFIR